MNDVADANLVVGLSIFGTVVVAIVAIAIAEWVRRRQRATLRRQIRAAWGITPTNIRAILEDETMTETKATYETSADTTAAPAKPTKMHVFAAVAREAVFYWFAAPGSGAPYIYDVELWGEEIIDDGDPYWFVGVRPFGEEGKGMDPMGYTYFGDGNVDRDDSWPDESEMTRIDLTLPIVTAALAEMVRFEDWCSKGGAGKPDDPKEASYRAEARVKAKAYKLVLDMIQGDECAIRHL